MGKSYKFLLFLLLILTGFVTNALSQEATFSVKEFYLDERDLKASSPPDSRVDQNGNLCARIKIESSYDFAIEAGGFGGIVDTKREGGEFWVYLPYKTTYLTSISHRDINEVIRNYKFNIPLQPGRSYIMKLNIPNAESYIFDASKKQTVKVRVIPRDAILDINGFSQALDSLGCLQIDMPYGIHRFSATADNYHSLLQRITIDDSSEGVEQVIILKQAYGWLETSLNDDESLFLDDKEYKLTSSKNGVFAVKSGNYRVRVDKPMYKPYTTTIQIKDSATVSLAPEFVPNYKELNFSVENSAAEIWIDGKLVGKGNWSGKLEYGEHAVETVLEKHKKAEHIFVISPDTDDAIELSSPEPMIGTLKLVSDPDHAEVFINNVKVGETPYSKDLLIGSYTVALRKQGFKSEIMQIDIEEEQVTSNYVTLSDVFPVEILIEPGGAKVLIDSSIRVNHSEVQLEAGEHSIDISANGYRSLHKKFTVESTGQSFSFRLKRTLYEKSHFYFGGTASTYNGNLMYGGQIGFYKGGFNMEFTYLVSNETSEEIFWNSMRPEIMHRPSVHIYTPKEMDFRLGWGILLGRGARLTPQIGAGYMKLDTQENRGGYNDAGKTCDALFVKGGLKLNIALGRVMELYVMPEFSAMAKPSNVYEALCDISPAIEKWGSGFGINAGFGFYF